MTDDRSPFKPRLREYLRARGVQITRTDADRISCLSGTHADNHPSMIVYEENLYCPACGVKMDIFEAAGALAGVTDFPSKKKEVLRVLNIQEEHDGRPDRGRDKRPDKAKRGTDPGARSGDSGPRGDGLPPEKLQKIHVSLPLDAARGIYTPAKLLDLAEKSLRWRPSEVRKEFVFRSLNAAGEIDLLEVRFEGHSDGKKKYLTFWYDGKSVRTAAPPILLYNRDKLSQDAREHAGTEGDPYTPVLIHEGPKCVFAAGLIPGFIHTGWNSGGKKWDMADWSILQGREVYVYPDDDKPGRETAHDLARRLASIASRVRVVEPLLEARAIRSEGADIVEALQVRTPEELAEYIKTGPSLENGRDPEPKAHTSGMAMPPTPGQSGTQSTTGATSGNPDSLPFRILGRADDGLTYFLDDSGSLSKCRLAALSKQFLMTLAPLAWWGLRYPSKGGVDWDGAIDYCNTLAKSVAFDPDNIRGRGAWRERDGRICYNTGADVLGERDPRRLYVRKTVREAGLDAESAPADARRAILDTVGRLSFESKADCVRALAWSVLAPFGGALPWRNAAILTGDSGSGKSTLLKYVIMPLVATPLYFSGEATAAGGRQSCGTDSLPFIIDEANDQSEAGQRRRKEWLSLMQQATSDDSPKVVKGTPSQDGAISYLMRQMFLFSAVTPDTGNVEQDNRIVSINLVRPDAENGAQAWAELEKEITTTVTETVCSGVRAFTWAHLREVLAAAEAWTPIVHDFPPHDTRKSYAEALLFAAFWRVFCDRLPGADELTSWLVKLYDLKAPEEKRNEPEELLDRLLDESVQVYGDRGNQMPLLALLAAIHTRKRAAWNQTLGEEGETEIDGATLLNYKRTAWACGLGVNRSGEVAVRAKHPAVMRILRSDHDYTKTLRRHPGFSPKGKLAYQPFSPYKGERQRNCYFIAGVLGDCPF